MLLLVALFVVVLVPVVGSVLAGAYRPHWWRWQQVAVAAVPLPGLGICFCLYVIARTWLTATPERCGVDACGMAVGLSLLLIGYALIAMAVGALLALLTLRLATGRWGGRRIQP